MARTITLTDAQVKSLVYLLSCHTGMGIPRYSWGVKDQTHAQQILALLDYDD